MYESIVVPMDLSTPHPAAVGVAEAIADRCGAAIRLVTVSTPGIEHGEDELTLAKLTEFVAGDVPGRLERPSGDGPPSSRIGALGLCPPPPVTPIMRTTISVSQGATQ